MNNVVKYVLIFSAGAAIGVAASWKILKTRYERIANEEIESVKQALANHQEHAEVETKDDSDEKEDDEEDPDVEEYMSVITSSGYSEKGTKYMAKPIVIAPDEYGEIEDYEKISLTYYEDGILTDDLDDIIEDIDSVIGRDSLNHFGEYEQDVVFVRNDRLKCDYEIMRVSVKYTD